MPDVTDTEPLARLVATRHAPATLIVRRCGCTSTTVTHEQDTQIGEWTVTRWVSEHLRHDDGTDTTGRATDEGLWRIHRPGIPAAAVLVTGLDVFHLVLALKRLRSPHTSPSAQSRWLDTTHRLLTDPARWARPRSTSQPTPDGAVVDAADMPAWLFTGFSHRAAITPFVRAGFECGDSVRDWLEVLPKADALAWAPHVSSPMVALLFRSAGYSADDAAVLGQRWSHLASDQHLLTAARDAGWTATHLRDGLRHYARHGGPDKARRDTADLIRTADGIDPTLLLLALRAGLSEAEAMDGLRDGSLGHGNLAVLAGLTG